MIAFIEGDLEEKNPDSVVVAAGGIGYEIKVPATVWDSLPSTGNKVRLYTYLQVREDALGLFGFSGKKDLEFFKLLITVNGVGPKAALGILSTFSADELSFAIMAGDAKGISKAPGIGGKTASKIILELKDKVQQMAVDEIQAKGEGIGDGSLPGKKEGSRAASLQRDAVEALKSLGYGHTQAYQAVSKVRMEEGMEVEQVLKECLKYLYQM